MSIVSWMTQILAINPETGQPYTPVLSASAEILDLPRQDQIGDGMTEPV